MSDVWNELWLVFHHKKDGCSLCTEIRALEDKVTKYEDALAPFAPGPRNILAPLFGITKENWKERKEVK